MPLASHFGISLWGLQQSVAYMEFLETSKGKKKIHLVKNKQKMFKNRFQKIERSNLFFKIYHTCKLRFRMMFLIHTYNSLTFLVDDKKLLCLLF